MVRFYEFAQPVHVVRLPTANSHPTLPLQARGGMTQALEIVTNSPNLVYHMGLNRAGGYEPPLQWLGDHRTIASKT